MRTMTRGKQSISRLIVFLGLFSFFRPTIFEKFELTNAIFNAILIFSLVLSFIELVRHKNLPNKWFLLVATAYYGTLLYSTIVHGGSLSRALMFALTGYFTVFFVKYMMSYELPFSTRLMRGLLWLYVIINFLTQMIPGGLATTEGGGAVFFLGQETRFAYFYLPALLFCILGDIYRYGRVSTNTFVIYFACLATLIAAWTVGSSLAFLALIAFFIFHRLKIFNVFTYFSVQAIAYIGLVYFAIQELFAIFIEVYLHKDASLSSRTFIWRNALEVIEDSPLLGAGVFTNDYNNDVLGFVHAHNHLLNITFQSGYLGLALFVLLIILGYITVHHYRHFFSAKVIGFFMFMIGIQLLVDTVDGVRNHYLFIIAMAAFFGDYIKLLNNKNNPSLRINVNMVRSNK